LDDLEGEAYQDSFSDGLIDLFVGLGIAVVGMTWLWLEPVAGLGGVFAAAVAWALPPIRRRIVEPRIGYVRWTAPRLKWERKQLRLLFWLLAVALLLGGAAFLAVLRGDGVSGDRNVVAGLPAILLAIGAFVLAATSGFKRLWGYGAVLVSAAAVTIIIKAGPGGSLLAAGAAVGVVGVVLLSRFLRAHPVRDMT
jgi:hypothetical protein